MSLTITKGLESAVGTAIRIAGIGIVFVALFVVVTLSHVLLTDVKLLVQFGHIFRE
jgi:hypothetical protein